MQNSIKSNQETKESIARLCFWANYILGIVSVVFIPNMLSLVVPLFGYVLIWLYWIETKTTNLYSFLRWAMSVVFNLLAGVVVVQALQKDSMTFFLTIVLLWIVATGLLSLEAIRRVVLIVRENRTY